MKTYTFVVQVFEGNDEFWENLKNDDKSGCDEVTDQVHENLQSLGNLTYKLDLVNYSNDVEVDI